MDLPFFFLSGTQGGLMTGGLGRRTPLHHKPSEIKVSKSFQGPFGSANRVSLGSSAFSSNFSLTASLLHTEIIFLL